ncbi:MAG TPA: hypothetical protein VFE42_12700 [Chloroflexota bacterium]|nr:hypothetical protein [Chloroflexota bacterium]
MAGIKQGTRSDLLPEVKSEPERTLDEIAESVDLSPAKVSVYNTLADLIPPLSVLMDKGQIPQSAALQLAQLPAEAQSMIAASFTAQQLASAADMKALKDGLATRCRKC